MLELQLIMCPSIANLYIFQSEGVRMVRLLLVCLASVLGQTCFEGPDGASMTEAKAGGHNIQVR